MVTVVVAMLNEAESKLKGIESTENSRYSGYSRRERERKRERKS